MSKNTFLEHMRQNIDPTAREVIELFSDGLNLPGSKIIEIILIYYGSLVSAYERSGIKQPGWTVPFRDTNDGETVSGRELYLELTKGFLRAFNKDDEKYKKLVVELYANAKQAEEEQKAIFNN